MPSNALCMKYITANKLLSLNPCLLFLLLGMVQSFPHPSYRRRSPLASGESMGNIRNGLLCNGTSCRSIGNSTDHINIIREINKEMIKTKILSALELEEPPKIDKGNLTIDEFFEKIRQENGISSSVEVEEEESEDQPKKAKSKEKGRKPGGVQKKTIRMYAEYASNVSSPDVMQFTLGDSERKGTLRVTKAQLNVLLKCPKKSSPRKVILIVYQVFDDPTKPDLHLITFKNKVKHTKWQKLMLPTTLLQSMVDNASSKNLYLRLECKNCVQQNVEPVMLYKPRKNKQKPQQPSSSKSKRQSRQTPRSNHRSVRGSQRRKEVTRRRKENKRRKRQELKRKMRMNKRRPVIVIVVKRKQNTRTIRKRHISECDSRKPGQCCKKTFYISFKELGWDDWIIQPKGYYANYCEGNCPKFIMPDQIAHRHGEVLEVFRHRNQNKAAYTFCCAPKKMKSLPLLYLNNEGNIIQTKLSDMSVEECGCA